MLVAAGLPTVPALLVPSPQLMVAVKSAGVVLAALVLTKLATRPLNDWPSVAVSVGWIGLTVSTSASATVMGLLAVAVAVPRASSPTRRATELFPSSA